MKVAFTGASSTGKTTLSQAIQFNDKTLKYINVDARKIISQLNHSNIDNLNLEEFIIFQKEWLSKKMKVESSIESFVTDRTYIDAIAYIINRKINDEKLFEIYLKKMEIYDYIFYLPIGRIPFSDDGYRSRNEKSNENVDSIILYLLDKYNITYHKVDISDFNKSLEYVLGVIGDSNV